VLADPADPRGYSLFSESFPGTLADRVAVPRANLVPKPSGVPFTDAACLPTAWLTAYHMLTAKGRVASADAVLVQGAGGGVATAAVVLAAALGKRVYATSRDPGKRERIAALGATALEPGARLPERVQVVIETVGAATFDHSLKCAAPGAGSSSPAPPPAIWPLWTFVRVFALQLEILGSSMGTVEELAALVDLCAAGLGRSWTRSSPSPTYGTRSRSSTAATSSGRSSSTTAADGVAGFAEVLLVALSGCDVCQYL
jgi:NADPH:quinone reductase-like Zn-dependent oxidoreductase